MPERKPRRFLRYGLYVSSLPETIALRFKKRVAMIIRAAMMLQIRHQPNHCRINCFLRKK
jgi:hypothetical protein